jgi:hypothetical protein
MHWGGTVADLLPGPVPWYNAIITCNGDQFAPIAAGVRTPAPKPATDSGCAQRCGTYLVNVTTRDDAHSRIAESLIVIPEQPTSIVPPCTGTIEYSADNCDMTIQQRCPIKEGSGAGGYSTEVDRRRWSLDGSTSSGITYLVIYNAAGDRVSGGTYDEKWTRQ